MCGPCRKFKKYDIIEVETLEEAVEKNVELSKNPTQKLLSSTIRLTEMTLKRTITLHQQM